MKAKPSSIVSLTLAGALLIGAAAAPALALAANEANDGQKSDQPVSDTWITTKVKSDLATTDGVKSMDISVKTVNGTVTLTGTQPDKAAIKKAVAATQSIKGVKHVDATGLIVQKETAEQK